MRKRLGQSVVIDNKTGANGALGVDAVLRAPKDQLTYSLGVWAAEGLADDQENFDLSEPRKSRNLGVAEGSSTPEFAEIFSTEILPPRLLANVRF